MAIQQQDYYLKPGETINAYNTRIATLRGESPEIISTLQSGGEVANYPTQKQFDIKRGIITGESITPPATDLSTQMNVPQPSLTYDTSKLDTNIPQITEMTTQEKEASELIKRLKGLETDYTGQAAYRVEQEVAKGTPELLKTQTDLSAQLKAVQNEQQAIELQFQKYASESGIAQPFVNIKKTEALRENAIKALSVSSLLEASRGNLMLANDLIDRAVKAKFDPIKEEIDAKRKNLELIIQSPEYTIADKNRALAQKAIQDKKDKTLTAEIKEKEEVYKIALEVAKNGVVDSLTLSKIQKAKTAEEALNIANQAGAFKKVIKPTTTEINAETYDTAKMEAAKLFETDRQRNQDKMVSPDLYYQMRQKVPVSFRDDFDRAFQHLLSEESKARFGIEFKPEITIQSTLDKTKKIFQQYKDANYSREDIENQYKAENKLEEIPETIKKIFDEVFGEKKSWWQW